jgi:glycosyltransferase involved in cell wall biosynthesis
MYATGGWGIGGTPRHLFNVLGHLDRRLFAPSLYCLDAQRPGPTLQPVRDLGVEIIDGRLRGSLHGTALAAAVVRMAGEMRRRATPIVHNYLFDANLVGTLAAHLARVPVTLTSRRSLDRYGKWHHRIAARLSNRLATRVTVPAEAIRRHLHAEEQCPLGKIVVIPNGVDLARVPLGPAADGTVVGALGRLEPRKGHADLLAAWPLVLDRFPDVRLILVGDGPARSSLEHQAQGLGIAGRVDMRGAVPEGARVLSEISVFVLPSHVEGMSNALLEAMAAGRPVVATDVGGNREVVVPGETGLLVPPRDPAAMAEAILVLVNDPERARAMGAAGQVRVREHFTVEQMIVRHQALYAGLLGERRGGQPLILC